MTIQLLHTGYGQFTARFPIGPARFDHFDLLWIHDGEVQMEMAQRSPVRIAAGGGVLIYPDTPFHGKTISTSVRASVQHFTPGCFEDGATLPQPFARLQSRRRGFELFRLSDPALLDGDFDRAMQWALLRQTPRVRDMRIAQLTLLLGELASHSTTEPAPAKDGDVFSDLIDWLDTQLHQPITIEDMARRVDQSTSHFRASFTARFGVSPGAYYKGMRMNEAARLIRETHQPIKAIAQQFGYQDIANFYRAFRNHTGHAPAEHRRRFQTHA